MNRRGFSRGVLGVLGAWAFPSGLVGSRGGILSLGEERSGMGSGGRPSPASQPSRKIDGPRLLGWLQDLSGFGRREDGGVDRVAFGEADLEARAWVMELMEESGLAVRVDAAGNILGRLEGSDPGSAPLMLGSHIDSVPAGGNYDGPLGTLGAVEVVRTLREGGEENRHPLEVVVFVNEEGGKSGSRIMAGEFRNEELALETASGFSIGEGIRRAGGDPERLAEARRGVGDVAGYLELHVEQGAVLEGAGDTIGVVEGIVGIRRWNATVRGAANHAGTTPMDRRKDALLGGARLVEAVNRVVRSVPGSQVATVGRIEAKPGVPNVIPGEAVLSIEVRALDMETIQRVMDGIRGEADAIGRENGTPISIQEFYLSEAAPTDPQFRDWVEAAAGELGLTSRRMPSGAGHDAQSVARFAPMGMIFIPSVGGLSHHPDEYSRPEDIEAGANVLLGTLLKADRGLD